MNPILLIAAILISWLVFTWLLRVVKTTLKTAFLLAILVLGLQMIVGIGPDQLLQAMLDLPHLFQELLSGQS